jgi:CMP-N-acetylneuraminic acid synthetase
MKVLGLIPARGGSKGLPRKNLCLVKGKPLIQYTIECALASKRLSRLVVSTEDAEIADVAERLGGEVPFFRPPELAQDQTPMISVAIHALEHLSRSDDPFDALCLLQPTNPLRRPSDIDGAIELLEQTGSESVISLVHVGDQHPARMKLVEGNGRIVNPPFAEQIEGQRRQDLPDLYLRDGSIYLTRSDTIMRSHSFQGGDCRAWVIPPERHCNIDTPVDLLLAESLLRYHENAET